MKPEHEERDMKRIATAVIATVARAARPGSSPFPAPANVMHTRPIFERSA